MNSQSEARGGGRQSSAGDTRKTNAIVVAAHRSNTTFLQNLLTSFQGYSKYPIVLVMLDYLQSDREAFTSIINKFSNLPLSLETLGTDSFELGGLYAAYSKTNYDELLLLSDSCEIVNPDIFDIVFNDYAGRSVAFGLQSGDWNEALGPRRGNERLILKYLDKASHDKLLQLGRIKFWQGHVGKYRREILNRMNLPEYLPHNGIEAMSKSEMLFTSTYHSLDSTTVVLFPDWIDGQVAEEKFGKKRLKIMNEYIIKWKGRYSPEIVFEEMRTKHPGLRAAKYAEDHAVKAFHWIKRQRPRSVIPG
jgi:hypothetical protein